VIMRSGDEMSDYEKNMCTTPTINNNTIIQVSVHYSSMCTTTFIDENLCIIPSKNIVH